MHLGVKIGPATEPQVKERGRKAEALGFDSVWLSERVAVPIDKPHPYQPMADPWIGLAYVAAVTERVKLGTSVSQIALRPPVLMARELATLDRLSGGRVIVGAGAGWVEEEFTSTGVPFETRGGRLSEFVQLLRHLWTQPEEPWKGRHFQIPGVKLVLPLTPGGPPIFIGASGPAGLRRVARYGDGFVAVMLPVEALTRLRQTLDEMASSFGRETPLPMYTQIKPPPGIGEARTALDDLSTAGVNGVIVADPLEAASSFPSDDVCQALVEMTR